MAGIFVRVSAHISIQERWRERERERERENGKVGSHNPVSRACPQLHTLGSTS
jgi:hypothetical protein